MLTGWEHYLKIKKRSPEWRPLGTLENYSTSVRSENTKGTLRHI